MNRLPFFKRITKIGLVLIVVSLAQAACAGAVPVTAPTKEAVPIVTETVKPLPTPTSVIMTPVPTLTLAAPTTTVSSPIPPTITRPPAPTFSLPDANRIIFDPGATYATASGQIGPGETLNFVLQVMQGQPMLASVSSTNNDVTMSIVAASGATLLPASQASSNWQGTLPATQEYYIQITGGASEQQYSLWVSIPSRIQFEAGAVSATVSGKTVEGNIVSYVVAAQDGQTMNIQLLPQPNLAALTVWGFSDGQPLMRAVMGSTTFNMQLPATQDYIIDVVPQAGQEVNYTLNIEIK